MTKTIYNRIPSISQDFKSSNKISKRSIQNCSVFLVAPCTLAEVHSKSAMSSKYDIQVGIAGVDGSKQSSSKRKNSGSFWIRVLRRSVNTSRTEDQNNSVRKQSQNICMQVPGLVLLQYTSDKKDQTYFSFCIINRKWHMPYKLTYNETDFLRCMAKQFPHTVSQSISVKFSLPEALSWNV